LEIKPEAILPNANNKAYFRIILDSDSLSFFVNNLDKIDNDLHRSYIWRIIADNSIRLNVDKLGVYP
jgi:hypothetical protein